MQTRTRCFQSFFIYPEGHMARLEHKSYRFWWLTISRRALKNQTSQVLFKMYLAQTFGQISQIEHRKKWDLNPPTKTNSQTAPLDISLGTGAGYGLCYRLPCMALDGDHPVSCSWPSTRGAGSHETWKVNMTWIGSLQYLKIERPEDLNTPELVRLYFWNFWLEIHINPGPLLSNIFVDFRWLQRLLCVSGPYNDSDGMVDAFTIRCGWCSPNSQSWKWFSLWSFSNLHHVKWIKVFGSLDVW